MSLEFVDTNILLYAYDPSAAAKHNAARDLLARLVGEHSAAVSVQILQEFYVNATRKIAVPLTHEDALARLRVFSQWPTHSPSAADVQAAAELSAQHQLSFWDAMVVKSASALGCQTLWSEDLNPGQTIAGVTIQDPFHNTPG
ncbi:MAG: PIN domain-containing protein [Propionibacteriaceae bacterium]|jgi:predicted nucleic acid-binding protein|nr:PIN domain-containing protein [Propionibacteriaceae bacterium]